MVVRGERKMALSDVMQIIKGRDKIIHRKGRCDLSLFTLGMLLLMRLLREGKTLPQFCLTLLGKALL